MLNESKLITEYVVLREFPETKTVAQKDENAQPYKFDVLKGIQIPRNPTTNRSYIKELEFKFSPNTNTPGLHKSAIEITRMIAEQHEKLKRGELYAKVSLFMSPRKNKNGIVDSYYPYINNVEFIQTNDDTRPYIEAALQSDETPVF